MSRPVSVLFRKEAGSALRAPSAWCVLAACVALVGLLFTLALRDAAGTATPLPALFCGGLALAAPLPAAFFTMGLFARERNNGTLETLLTAPVTDGEVVLGKFLAAYALTLFALALCLLDFAVYRRVAAPPPPFATAPLFAGWGAVAAAAALWTAFGTLASLFVRHESAAGACTLLFGLALTVAATTADSVVPSGSFLDMLNPVAFAEGMADTRPVFACLSGTAFFLFCAVRLLESRRWSAVSPR